MCLVEDGTESFDELNPCVPHDDGGFNQPLVPHTQAERIRHGTISAQQGVPLPQGLVVIRSSRTVGGSEL